MPHGLCGIDGAVGAGPERELLIASERHAGIQQVLVDHAVFHDDQEAFRRVRDQLDVCNRVTVDQQEVSECALLDDAKPAWIGIALAR